MSQDSNFPAITSWAPYLRHGRARAAGRKQRIKNYMENTQQWVPLTGPGGRLPTEDDSDENGYVWFHLHDDAKAHHCHWSYYGDKLAFMPIEKRLAPPLPKPAELSQEEKDLNAAREIYSAGSVMDDIISGIAYGRSDGRAQLAREALGLFDKNLRLALNEIADPLDVAGYAGSAAAIRILHDLLAKAAEETS